MSATKGTVWVCIGSANTRPTGRVCNLAQLQLLGNICTAGACRLPRGYVMNERRVSRSTWFSSGCGVYTTVSASVSGVANRVVSGDTGGLRSWSTCRSSSLWSVTAYLASSALNGPSMSATTYHARRRAALVPNPPGLVDIRRNASSSCAAMAASTAASRWKIQDVEAAFSSKTVLISFSAMLVEPRPWRRYGFY